MNFEANMPTMAMQFDSRDMILMFPGKVDRNMKFRRLLTAVLAAAMLASSGVGCVPAWAEEEPPVEEPKQEEPKQEESKQEEPKQEEPKQEEPKQEEPKQEEPQQQEPQQQEPETNEPAPADPEPVTPPEEPQETWHEIEGPTIAPEPEDDPTPDPYYDPEEEFITPEPTLEPEKGSISIKGSSIKDAVAGSELTFKFKAKNMESLSYRITGPDGNTVASGRLDADATSLRFTPNQAGKYTLTLVGTGLDGNDVGVRKSFTVAKMPELTLEVKADHECCHAGEDTSFTLTVPDGVDIELCSIKATMGGKEIFSSDRFKTNITVSVPQSKKVTKVTLSVRVRDALERTAEGSVTIPCAINEREKRSQWEATMAGVVKTGIWPEDLIAIAKTQVGYKESSKDFGEKHGGGISGYTRYGDWAGMRYDEWCAMFASFCLHYAGITEENFARASNCQRWINRLVKQDLYADRGAYEPKLGDLVFFEWGGDNASDHVGIIAKLENDKKGNLTAFVTIEGNSKGGAVTFNDRYKLNDSRIVGYGLVNLAYERYVQGVLKTLPAEEQDPEAAEDEEAEEAVEVEAVPEVVNNTASDSGVTVTADYGDKAALPEGTRLIIKVLSPEDRGYEDYMRSLRQSVGEAELAEARFVEIRFVDESGAEVQPQGPVKLSVSVDGKLNASRALLPGVATFGAAAPSINPEVELTRTDAARQYDFEQSNFDGVICAYVAGDLKYKKDAAEAATGDVTAKLAYEADSHVPVGSDLIFREITPDSDEYDTCLARLGDIADGETVRFFEIGLELNGLEIEPQGMVTLTIACDQPADDVRAVRLNDGQFFPTKVNHRINGQTSVRFDVNATGIFALGYMGK